MLSHCKVELNLFLNAVLSLKHGHSSNSSHMLVFTDGGEGHRGKVQVRQEIIPQCSTHWLLKEIKILGYTHCAVNQVIFLFVCGNSPHAS